MRTPSGILSLPCRQFIPAHSIGKISERDSIYIEETVQIPINQCALILMDAWWQHATTEYGDRIRKNIIEYLEPLIQIARCTSITIIHINNDLNDNSPILPLAGELLINHGLSTIGFAELLLNFKKKILFYVGYASNWCLLFRSCGIHNVIQTEKFECVFVRDASIAYEMPDTLEQELCHKVIINIIEEQFGRSTTTAQFIAACKNSFYCFISILMTMPEIW